MTDEQLAMKLLAPAAANKHSPDVLLDTLRQVLELHTDNEVVADLIEDMESAGISINEE